METRALKLGPGAGSSFQSSASFLADGPATEPDSLFALDVLRQRLHEKIREARGQVGGGALGGQEQRVCCSGFPLCLERRCALRGRPPALPATVGLSRIAGPCGADRGSAAPFCKRPGVLVSGSLSPQGHLPFAGLGEAGLCGTHAGGTSVHRNVPAA